MPKYGFSAKTTKISTKGLFLLVVVLFAVLVSEGHCREVQGLNLPLKEKKKKKKR